MSVLIGGVCGGVSLLYIVYLIKKHKWTCFRIPRVLADLILSGLVSYFALTKGFSAAAMFFIVSCVVSIGLKFMVWR